jgi:NAD(P)-dependent dehydrogenase (short-subunit alcohol dehydrogenase family)
VKEALPNLRLTKGHVVFTSSGAALNAYASWGAYGSSKAAMNSLAQHIAVEEQEVTAIAIGPGRVDTEMQKEIRELGAPGTAMSKADHADFMSVHESGKLNKPEWPAEVIAKLSLSTKAAVNGKYLR